MKKPFSLFLLVAVIVSFTACEVKNSDLKHTDFSRIESSYTFDEIISTTSFTFHFNSDILTTEDIVNKNQIPKITTKAKKITTTKMTNNEKSDEKISLTKNRNKTTTEKTNFTTYSETKVTTHIVSTTQIIETKTTCNHILVVDKAAVEPTCTSSGKTESMRCASCNEIIIEQEIIPAVPHNEVVDKGIEASCVTTGLTEGKHCSFCNKTIVKQEITPKAEHVYEEWKVKTPATCQTTGIKTRKCKNCNDEQTEEIDKSSHEYESSYIAGDGGAACITYTCRNCPHTYNEEVKPVTGNITKTAWSSIVTSMGARIVCEYTVDASGGYGEYEYKYEYYRGTSGNTPELLRDFSDKNTIEITNPQSGSVLKVTIKDSVGNTNIIEVTLE